MMKEIFIVSGMALLSGCGLLKPASITAGYYIDNKSESKPTIVLGSNNTQANSINSPLGAVASGDESGKAEADASAGKATASGLFVNNTVGNRSADIDATTSLEKLQRVSNSTAGQTQGRDSSPATSTQTPTTTHTTTTTTSVPVSLTKTGTATSSTAGDASPLPTDETDAATKTESK